MDYLELISNIAGKANPIIALLVMIWGVVATIKKMSTVVLPSTRTINT